MLVLVSAVAAFLAARIDLTGRGWLWNFDMPAFDYPIAQFFSDALREGRLPLWNDRLGLGFPLYAEGQIGAFYPPNWLYFQLPPLVALDVLRVTHLVFMGVGMGLLAFRVAGSRVGAVVAAAAIVLSGGVVTKLEWHNLLEGFAWVPWLLIPLVRRPHPTRSGLVLAGIGWGIMALPSHPNIFIMTGLAILAVMLATRPRLDTLPRLVVVGIVAAGVGAVQLVPSALLWSLSVRSSGLATDDLFRLTAMPFDLLGAAFANVFVEAGSPVEISRTWYPGGTWSPLEIGAYVGLGVIALAVIGAGARRGRPFVVGGAVFILLPIIGGQRPALWAALPVWNGLHAPVKGYIFLGLFLILLAAIGLGRLERSRVNWRPPAAVVAVFVGAYALLAGIVLLAPGFFRGLVTRFWSWPPPGNEGYVLDRATEALSKPWPLVLELAIAAAVLWLVSAPSRARLGVAAIGALVLLPLAILSPPFNRVFPESEFSYAGTTFVRTLAETRPARVVTMGGPLFWHGMPDQLAAAGIRDVAMFSSLNLKASNDLRDQLIVRDLGRLAARVVGVDTLVTVGGPCDGTALATVPESNAWICRIEGALRPPYWLPTSAARVPDELPGSPIRPVDAELDLAAVLASARPAAVELRTDDSGRYVVDAPGPGWVFIDRSWWPVWQTRVDGIEQPTFRALSGQLIPVGAGRHVIQQALVPWDAGLGFGIGLLTVLVALTWAGVPRAVARRGRPWLGWVGGA